MPDVDDLSPVPTRRPPAAGQLWRRLGRDYEYVLPGFPLALFGFVLLVPLTAASLGTLIVWVGLPLLLVTLWVATGFAELSRARIRRWGVPVDTALYRPAGPGVRGALRALTDPRRWLDLVFETLVAYPMRLITFVVAVIWTALPLGGLTHVLWAWSLPDDSGWIQLLEIVAPSRVPESPGAQYLLDSGINFGIGLVFLFTLPAMMHALARLDVDISTALLGAATRNAEDGTEARPAHPATGRATGAVARATAFSGSAWTWLAVSFAAGVLVAVGWPVTAALYGVHPALAMVLTVAHSGAAVLTVRYVWAGLALSAGAGLGMIVATADAAGTWPWPWPVTTLLTHCLIIVVLALRRSWVWAWAAWAVGVLLTIAALLVGPAGVPDGAMANGIVFVSVSAGVAIIGALGRLWTLSASRVEQAETISADEARRRRELQERNRIARELHDVVAHSMSVINVQATTARYRKPHIDESVQQEFADIAESSRRALGEMRALLAILRGDDAAPTAPVPSLGDIGELVEASRASGTAISYTGDGKEVSATVGLTAFRVVQEALSNALRHAPGASVEVVTAVEGDALKIRVVNSAPEGQADPAPGSGLGLAGIRERVFALDGNVTAEATPHGGFVVAASLPLDAD